MKFITQRMMILGVVDQWRTTYPPGRHGYGLDKDMIYARLTALDLETVSAEQVNAIIGNDSWTATRCDECGNTVACVVRVGAEPDYESATASLCEACVKAALALFGEAQP